VRVNKGEIILRAWLEEGVIYYEPKLLEEINFNSKNLFALNNLSNKKQKRLKNPVKNKRAGFKSCPFIFNLSISTQGVDREESSSLLFPESLLPERQ